MTKLRRVILSCVWLYAFGAIPFVHADNPPAAHSTPQTWKHGGGGGFQEIYSQLHLTEAQKKQLEDNKTQHHAKMKNDREQMKSDREAFRAELMKPQLDMNKINELHNRIKALESQMADDRLNSILAVRAILTPQQFSEFATLMPKHKMEHAKSGEHEDHE